MRDATAGATVPQPAPSRGAMAVRRPASRPRVTIVAALCTALAACATGRMPRVPDIAMPVTYDAAAREALPAATLDTWWRLYDDPQLVSLVERALAGGFDARLALARLDEAQAIRGQALAAYAPQGAVQAAADTTGSRNLDDGPDPGRTRSVSANVPVSWELDLFGRRAAARDAADADLAAVRFEYEAARAALVAQVAQTLFQARGLASQLEDARASERIQGELVALLDRRVERGLAAASQADRVAGDLALARAQALALDSELAAAKRALLVLLGDGLADPATLPIAADMAQAPSIPATVPGDLLLRRPDIRQAQARIRAAAGAVRLAELDFFPTLSFTPGVGASRQRGGALESATAFWTLGVGLTVPVLDRPRLLAALDLQGARGEQAVIGYEQAVQTAYAEADQALTRLAADRARIVLLVDGEARARRAHEAAEIRFRRGLGDLQGALDAEAAWRATRSALTTARLDALLRSVQSFKALGGGWPADATPSLPVERP